MKITKQDSNGVKPLLQTGELGYDNYVVGGDSGRVYVGTGSQNIALGKKAEIDAVSTTAANHIGNTSNPHNVTKAQVGLSNVQNVDTTNAGNITSGILGVGVGGTGTNASTGTGAVVLSNSPTLTTPNIGAATGISFSGNSATATKWSTARSINGSSVDGTTDVTTAKWGTARNITIGGSTKSVDGSGNVAWTLNEVGATGLTNPQFTDSISLGGTVLSNWTSLDVMEAGSGVFFGSNDVSALSGSNCYYDGTWRYKVDGSAGLQLVNRGSHQFRVAPAGLAGQPITWEVVGNFETTGLNAKAGTAALPGFGFLNDVDTGMYNSGPNEVSLVAGGTSKVVVKTTGAELDATPIEGDNSTRIATTEFVDTAIAGISFPSTTVVGSIITLAYNGTTPDGYIKCNGAAISRSTYAALFSVISTTYGVGNGSTTFNLPDLRGEFIRGFDDARGVDTSRVFGSSQVDMFKSHTHTETRLGENVGSPYGAGGGTTVQYQSVATGATGGTETRPRNIAMNFYIKY